MIIDTQGFSDTVAQSLQTGTGTTSIDGGLTKLGSGLLTLTGANTYTGPTTVYGGLQLGDGSANTGSVAGNIVLINSATLTFANPGALSYAMSISGSGGLVNTGGGALTLSGSNSYSGSTTINAGAIMYDNFASVPPAHPINIAPGAAMGGPIYGSINAWLASGLVGAGTSGAIAIAAPSSEDINLATAPNGPYPALALGSIGNNTYTGTLTPSGSNYALGGGTGLLTLPNNGELVDGGSPRGLAVVGNVALSGSNSYSGGTTVYPTGQLSVNTASAIGTGALTVNGGQVVLASSNGYAVLGNVNLVNNGSSEVLYTLQNNQFAPGCAMLFTSNVTNRCSVELLGTTQTLAGIDNTAASGYGIIQNYQQAPVASACASTLVLNGTGSYTFNGSLCNGTSGALGLVKNGTGTQSLLGANIAFTGPTVVNAGVLQVGGPNQGTSGLGYCSSVVVNGGTLMDATGDNGLFGSTSTVPVAVNAGGVISAISGATNHVAGPLTLSGGTLGGPATATGDAATWGTWDSRQ